MVETHAGADDARANTTADDELYAQEAAVYLGELVRKRAYSKGTLYNLASAGTLPPDLRRRGRPVWRRSTLERWARQQVTVGSGRHASQ
jgi:predicted DNA-binding transcriptional regulator AlpA